MPKVEHSSPLTFVDHLLTGALADSSQTAPSVCLDALVESAAGIRALDPILTASERLRAVVIGYADLGADLGCDLGDLPAADALRGSLRARTLVAARAAGRFVIDGPWLSVGVDDRFIEDRAKARDQGFDGSWAIHPAQLETLNALFSPTPDQLSWAQRVLDVLASAGASGAGAAALDGQMLDEAIAVRARRILARAEKPDA